MKKSIKLLKKIERTFPGDSLINDKSSPLTLRDIGTDEETFNLLKILEKSGLIVGWAYRVEGLPKKEKEVRIEAVKITPLGIELLNGLRQKRTNTILIILTFLMTLIGCIQIYLMLS